MPILVLMPALSPTMTHGNLVRWCKKEGDFLKSGDVLAEIETDKATMEIEVVDEGILGRIVIAEGTENVQVNSLIALILEEGEDVSIIEKEIVSSQAQDSSKTFPSSLSAPAVSPEFPAKKEGDRIIASPLAKRLAREQNIPLKDLKGSGPKGRIVAADLQNYTPLLSFLQQDSFSEIAYKDVPLSSVRKIIGKRLQESKQTIPHFYVSVECCMDTLLSLRKSLPVKFSINDFIVKACALAMQNFPEVNATYHNNFVRHYQSSDICVAVSVEGGLLTPIVKHAEKKTLQKLSQEIKILAERARKGNLTPEEYQGGGLTISNLGMYGVSSFGAIINPPQACILAVSGTREIPFIKENNITIANIMTLTLSADHRIVDGAYAAEFINEIKKFLEEPLHLLI